MRAAILVMCIASPVYADTFETHDKIGLDVVTVWEPAASDHAFSAGPVFRYEGFSSQLPPWFGLVVRSGTLFDQDRVLTLLGLGMMLRPLEHGLYASIEGGVSYAARAEPNHPEMDYVWRHDWLGAAALGYRAGVWDLRASATVGGVFAETAWMFSIGRDFVRFDSTVTRTKL